MASELSRYIEQELERKGIDPNDDRQNLIRKETFRIEVRLLFQDTKEFVFHDEAWKSSTEKGVKDD